MARIYSLTDPRTNNPRYVGYTTRSLAERWESHIKDSIRHNKTHKHNWIKELLKLCMVPDIVLIKELTPEENKNWQYWETHYIKEYRRLGYDLTNGTDGGEGVTQTPEVRAKIGAKSKLHRHSEAAKDKMRKAKLGKTGALCPNSKALIAYNAQEELHFGSAQEAERYFRDRGLKASSKNIGQCLTGQKIKGKYIRTQVAGYKFKRA